MSFTTIFNKLQIPVLTFTENYILLMKRQCYQDGKYNFIILMCEKASRLGLPEIITYFGNIINININNILKITSITRKEY